jgi:hypothetical protein
MGYISVEQVHDYYTVRSEYRDNSTLKKTVTCRQTSVYLGPASVYRNLRGKRE